MGLVNAISAVTASTLRNAILYWIDLAIPVSERCY
jgi:hypothetical protein